jgi:anti-sigma regulatory factor (Ser/Thr protein kinase)
MVYSFDIVGGDFSMAGVASSRLKNMLKQLNLPQDLIKRTIISCYEAEINVVAHAFRGKMTVSIDHDQIKMQFVDEGPGIPDIQKAMQEGFSTASDHVREMGFGAGMGLPNIKRNADYLDIQSTVNQGTHVVIINKISL